LRLVFVTQQVDPASPVLGATVAKIRALSALVDEVVVLADGAVEGALPANCRIRLFRSGTKIGRGLRFESAVLQELARRPRPDAIVAHMCPIYAVLAAPAARPLGVRVLLWFTHWKRSRLLVAAERVSSAVITVEPRSFPLDSSTKVVPIGHGIDLGRYACVEAAGGDGIDLLALGRTSPAKGLETVVRAVALVPGVRLVVRGPSLTAEERRCRESLERLIVELGLEERVELGGPVPHDEVPMLLREADVLVNNMRAGATDKVVYEAAASCRPVLASNPALDTFLPEELRFPRDDPAALAARIRALFGADLTAIGRELRDRVAREHSADGWAMRVVEVARG
jgi:glycosyltransferase involved in cell wall biosynthesis